MRRFLYTSAMVAVLLAAVRAQSARYGSIAGRVVDSTSGAPLHRARVEIHVEGHDDLVALSIQYNTDPPISYKQKINSVFTA